MLIKLDLFIPTYTAFSALRLRTENGFSTLRSIRGSNVGADLKAGEKALIGAPAP
jgi:hypothetical protein